MNEKEISEIRRRFRADKHNIAHIRGCYVNEKKEIIAQFDQSMALLGQTETEQIIALLRKTLSGGVDKMWDFARIGTARSGHQIEVDTPAKIRPGAHLRSRPFRIRHINK